MFLFDYISLLGKSFVTKVVLFGKGIILLYQLIISVPYIFRRIGLLMQEIYFCGVKSLIIILFSASFVGMVLSLQSYLTLVRFNSTSLLGSAVAIALLRELSPVLSAILFASRAGSSITSAIGLMKTTEQLSAMSVMSVNPVKRVLLPKFLGLLISLPLLTPIFSIVSILIALMIGVYSLHLDFLTLWVQMHQSISLQFDIVNGIIKSVIFAILISIISVFFGISADATADGVASATTSTVVYSALSVLLADYILTSIMF